MAYPKSGVCKTWTGYLRMADADGKMRMVKKMRITKKVRRKKTRNADDKTNKQTIKERNLSFK